MKISLKKLPIYTVFLSLGLLFFFTISCGDKSSNNNQKPNDSQTTNPSTQSTAPSFTCRNCGGHSFHYHETLTDMKVCNSCGIGN